MGSKMLIDASQREEIRVVVARGNRIEEFDFESAARKPLKGNIYLAKVTRVEPSLQAAFVEYGGNRHGFLAFAEIHPDYYQIPIADRLALLKEQEEEAAADDEDPDNGNDAETDAEGTADGDSGDDRESDPGSEIATSDSLDAEPVEHRPHQGKSTPGHDVKALEAGDMPFVTSEPGPDLQSPEAVEGNDFSADETETPPTEVVANGEVVSIEEDPESQKVESVGAEDALEEVPRRRERRQPRRRYKIQEVIKRRQILLVQVVKEERGNKGAALTTYLSLAGRYCVLMPNTARGGGISRKITDAGDRRRLKEVAREVEVPQGMGLIVRTAGAQRTRPEIKRDFDYLMRLWESVRDLTLRSQAPCLVYEEGNLIKRSIRDLYTKDVEEVIVEGEAAYREAKDFMKMLMPSHAKNVKLYSDNKPLFTRYQVESHLDALFSPTVVLQSGGYLVINQTEALVSIDINSGKSTREHSIEDTALRTNLEAADEIARQLRLRDLAGLIVIDFIDMEENRNNRAVERRLKEALKHDRARIQVGRISHFGLLEMSRQRLRPGLMEGTFRTCPHCEGRGMVRSVASCALGVIRAIEDTLIKRAENLTVSCARDVAFYLLNEKRDTLLDLEQTYGVTIFVTPAQSDMKGTQHHIERAQDRQVPARRVVAAAPVRMDSAFDDDEPLEAATPAAQGGSEKEPESFEGNDFAREEQEGRDGGRRRRRRGRRGGRGSREQPDDQFDRQDMAADSDRLPDGGKIDRMTEPESELAGEASSDEETSEIVSGDVEGVPADRPYRTGDQLRRGRRQRPGPNNRDDDHSLSQEAESPPASAAESGANGTAPREQFEFAADEIKAEAGEGHDRPNRGHRRDRRERGERRSARDNKRDRGSPVFNVAPPAPQPQIIIPDVIPDPEPRKWQPPTATIQATEVKKGGWWNKRKQG